MRPKIGPSPSFGMGLKCRVSGKAMMSGHGATLVLQGRGDRQDRGRRDRRDGGAADEPAVVPGDLQCKRWQGSVGAPTVRDFRGAMVGRADKGLILTTGTFTAEARREAVRDGAPAIDLVDGEMLCDLLRQHRLGVRVEMVERVTIDAVALSAI